MEKAWKHEPGEQVIDRDRLFELQLAAGSKTRKIWQYRGKMSDPRVAAQVDLNRLTPDSERPKLEDLPVTNVQVFETETQDGEKQQIAAGERGGITQAAFVNRQPQTTETTPVMTAETLAVEKVATPSAGQEVKPAENVTEPVAPEQASASSEAAPEVQETAAAGGELGNAPEANKGRDYDAEIQMLYRNISVNQDMVEYFRNRGNAERAEEIQTLIDRMQEEKDKLEQERQREQQTNLDPARKSILERIRGSKAFKAIAGAVAGAALIGIMAGLNFGKQRDNKTADVAPESTSYSYSMQSVQDLPSAERIETPEATVDLHAPDLFERYSRQEIGEALLDEYLDPAKTETLENGVVADWTDFESEDKTGETNFGPSLEYLVELDENGAARFRDFNEATEEIMGRAARNPYALMSFVASQPFMMENLSVEQGSNFNENVKNLEAKFDGAMQKQALADFYHFWTHSDVGVNYVEGVVWSVGQNENGVFEGINRRANSYTVTVRDENGNSFEGRLACGVQPIRRDNPEPSVVLPELPPDPEPETPDPSPDPEPPVPPTPPTPPAPEEGLKPKDPEHTQEVVNEGGQTQIVDPQPVNPDDVTPKPSFPAEPETPPTPETPPAPEVPPAPPVTPPGDAGAQAEADAGEKTENIDPNSPEGQDIANAFDNHS